MATILVVDDEIGIRELLSEILSDEGHAVLTAENAATARSLRQRETPDLVLLDIWMPDTDGVTLLKEWAAGGQLTMPVIMMSGHATIDTAVEATRFGALDFLEKPIALQKLLKAVEQGLTRGRAAAAAAVARPPAPTFVPAAATSAQPVVTTRTILLADTPAPPSPESFGRAPGTVSAFAPVHAPGAAPPAGAVVALRDLPLDLPLREARDAFERAYFEHHLAREHGSMTRVAEKTGLERTHLYRKLKQLGIDLSRGAYRKNQSS
jgi:DNA-binding NtrC family response regulator